MWILGLAGLTVAVGISVRWTVWAFRVALRDSEELRRKLTWPVPLRACEWPELRLGAVVFDPEVAERVLLDAYWPAHPEVRSYLTLDLLESAPHSRTLLRRWWVASASLSPTEHDGAIVLRRRRSGDVIHARVVAEAAQRSSDDG